jgi:hypothetical protein
MNGGIMHGNYMSSFNVGPLLHPSNDKSEDVMATLNFCFDSAVINYDANKYKGGEVAWAAPNARSAKELSASTGEGGETLLDTVKLDIEEKYGSVLQDREKARQAAKVKAQEEAVPTAASAAASVASARRQIAAEKASRGGSGAPAASSFFASRAAAFAGGASSGGAASTVSSDSSPQRPAGRTTASSAALPVRRGRSAGGVASSAPSPVGRGHVHGHPLEAPPPVPRPGTTSRFRRTSGPQRKKPTRGGAAAASSQARGRSRTLGRTGARGAQKGTRKGTQKGAKKGVQKGTSSRRRRRRPSAASDAEEPRPHSFLDDPKFSPWMSVQSVALAKTGIRAPSQASPAAAEAARNVLQERQDANISVLFTIPGRSRRSYSDGVRNALVWGEMESESAPKEGAVAGVGAEEGGATAAASASAPASAPASAATSVRFHLGEDDTTTLPSTILSTHTHAEEAGVCGGGGGDAEKEEEAGVVHTSTLLSGVASTGVGGVSVLTRPFRRRDASEQDPRAFKFLPPSWTSCIRPAGIVTPREPGTAAALRMCI